MLAICPESFCFRLSNGLQVCRYTCWKPAHAVASGIRTCWGFKKRNICRNLNLLVCNMWLLSTRQSKCVNQNSIKPVNYVSKFYKWKKRTDCFLFHAFILCFERIWVKLIWQNSVWVFWDATEMILCNSRLKNPKVEAWSCSYTANS